jgi:hypothetical protein
MGWAEFMLIWLFYLEGVNTRRDAPAIIGIQMD